MLAAAVVPSSPPSSLLPYFGPGRAGQVVPRLDLSYLLEAQLGDDGSSGGGGKSLAGAALVIGLGALALGAIAVINEYKHHPRRRR